MGASSALFQLPSSKAIPITREAKITKLIFLILNIVLEFGYKLMKSGAKVCKLNRYCLL